MSVKSSIRVLLVGLTNRASFLERRERLLNNLDNIRHSNEQNPIRLYNLHPPPDSNSSLTDVNRLPDRYLNRFNYEIHLSDDITCPNGSFGSLRDAMLIELERLRRIMNGDVIEDDKNFIALSEEEKAIFRQFLEYFSTCPICKKSNHKSYLKTFYFSDNLDKKILKKRLLKLIEESKEYDDVYYNKISFGIPCCNCFKKVFCDF